MQKQRKVSAYLVLTPNEPPWPEHDIAHNEGGAVAVYFSKGHAREHYDSFPIVPCTITFTTPSHD